VQLHACPSTFRYACERNFLASFLRPNDRDILIHARATGYAKSADSEGLGGFRNPKAVRIHASRKATPSAVDGSLFPGQRRAISARNEILEGSDSLVEGIADKAIHRRLSVVIEQFHRK
jgi:hypothetical protein